MTKAALVNITKSLAIEYAPKIRVNALVPAIGNTSMLTASFDGRQPDEKELDWIFSWIPVSSVPFDFRETALVSRLLCNTAYRAVYSADPSLPHR